MPLLQAAAEKKAVSREKAKQEVEVRKTLFVHVRLNRVHCRVTYQVPSCPLSRISGMCGVASTHKHWGPQDPGALCATGCTLLGSHLSGCCKQRGRAGCTGHKKLFWR